MRSSFSHKFAYKAAVALRLSFMIASYRWIDAARCWGMSKKNELQNVNFFKFLIEN